MATFVGGKITKVKIGDREYRASSIRLDVECSDVTNFETPFGLEFVPSVMTCDMELLEPLEIRFAEPVPVVAMGYAFTGVMTDWDVACFQASCVIYRARFRSRGEFKFVGQEPMSEPPKLYVPPPPSPYASTRRRKIFLREAV